MSDPDALTNSSQVGNALVWDIEGVPPAGTGPTILWRAFVTEASLECISIPQLIEENSDTLRARYLAWVYEMGEIVIDRKRLTDHFELRPGFSYWWMTLIAEKCNSKSPSIADAIRLFAFDDLVRQVPEITSVTLVSANKPLHESFKCWCELKEIEFESKFITTTSEPKSLLRRTFDRLPDVVQAGITLLKYLIERWPLRGVGLQAWRHTKGKTTFITYSDNCLRESLQNGRYFNNYWSHLPDVLEEEEIPSNWLHIYVKDELLSTSAQAAVALEAFNRSSQGFQSHVTLDSFIGLGVIFRTLRDYLCLFRTSVSFGAALEFMSERPVALWPLLRADWHASMFGQVAIKNLLFLNLFEAAMKALPKQQQGIYLEENMGWEFGFIHAWRIAGHGQLIGVPHSTVRFWDLRYFFDPRSYLRTGLNDLPLPDWVACNGPVMRATYQQGGYPFEDLLDVEALRYLYLSQTQRKTEPAALRKDEPLRLLVLGGYLQDDTRMQLKLLEQALSLFSQQLLIKVKPHPNCPIHPGDYSVLQMRISVEPVSKLLAECDIAYASADTSAAVDAYCSGVPIISVLDPTTLNLSPLWGVVEPLFISTPDELASALTSAASGQFGTNHQPAYFTIDDKLPSWRRLLL